MSRRDLYLTSYEKKNRDRAFDAGRIYMAKIKDVRNVSRTGEIKVWLYSSEVREDDETRWVVASYASSFFGTSPHETGSVSAVTSFGAWFPIPYVGNNVFVFFPYIRGQNTSAYWFSCPVDSDTNSMIPGIPTAYSENVRAPLTEYNSKNYDSAANARNSSVATKDSEREVYTPLNEALIKQGLQNDLLRGVSTSGSKRESPSNCYGILTPLGNSFVMDDGWDSSENKTNWRDSSVKGNTNKPSSELSDTNRPNAGFRLRTRNGTQLLISDNGNIYMINRDGSAWVEITDDGHIDCFSEKGINAASNGDINLNSKKRVNIVGEEGISLKTNGPISIEASGDTNLKTPHTNIESIMSVPQLLCNVGNITSFTSASAQINGTFKGTLEGTTTYATSAGTVPSAQPLPTTPSASLTPPLLTEEKPIPAQGDATQSSINSRVPTHEPYGIHEQLGDKGLTLNGETLDVSVKPSTTTTSKTQSPKVSNTI